MVLLNIIIDISIIVFLSLVYLLCVSYSRRMSQRKRLFMPKWPQSRDLSLLQLQPMQTLRMYAYTVAFLRLVSYFYYHYVLCFAVCVLWYRVYNISQRERRRKRMVKRMARERKKKQRTLRKAVAMRLIQSLNARSMFDYVYFVSRQSHYHSLTQTTAPHS